VAVEPSRFEAKIPKFSRLTHLTVKTRHRFWHIVAFVEVIERRRPSPGKSERNNLAGLSPRFPSRRELRGRSAVRIFES
jgi:hypothetical protein